MQLVNIIACTLLPLLSINSEKTSKCHNSNGNNGSVDALESKFNTPTAECNAEYWTEKLKGTKRSGTTYSINGKSLITVKRKAYLGNCEILSRNFDPDRLVFYFKDDDCIEFEKADCN
ncbi:hypothetical protein CONCODRAFT_15414 [Conidiobolus coronatus NRRL 28638]|uniref:Uncharacterized protein n=1 Tax=Conidiobolus coronatus (strain ATCC 28846 / CBS 209.66 / NRRL 28638) TaxID=796925 RepID=A0A137PEX1_CONC2|nr:hypothetical protein CONCODRAFT_15414 [Conidiobolus coronatus NRRL 28638]|eukprot:KXN73515.1 hypothetical protein CONCODRAFT_15414 [Conidiobolus coronatus NRRL 28638]